MSGVVAPKMEARNVSGVNTPEEFVKKIGGKRTINRVININAYGSFLKINALINISDPYCQ